MCIYKLSCTLLADEPCIGNFWRAKLSEITGSN